MVLSLVDYVWLFFLSPTQRVKEGWDFWIANTPNYKAYTKEVQFFRIFNIAWIFCWEYRYQNVLINSFSLYSVRIYKVRWWNEYKTKLYGKENVEYFCRIKTKNSPFKTFILLTKRKGLHVVHYPYLNENLFFHHKIQVQGFITKTKRYSRGPQRWPSHETNLFYKNSSTMMTPMTGQV